MIVSFVIRAAARRGGVLLAVLLALGACAYRGGTDDPVSRRLSWFSYLNGDGLRESCGPGTIDRYRLVYNGRYNEQLRTYEVTGDGAGGAILVSRALGQANLANVDLYDLLGPWRWERSEGRLSPAETREFIEILERSGMFAGAPEGLRLNSWRFYWVASGCHDGTYHFAAWQHPSAGWDKLAFPEFLLARDGTGVPFNPPRPVSPAENFIRGPADERPPEKRFTLTVRGSGLGGVTTID